MKGILYTGVALVLFGSAACAENQPPPEPQVMYGQSYQLIVSDPAAFAAAMTAFRNSPTGQQAISAASLNQNVANGEYPGTHSVNVFYPSAAAMEAALTANTTSADWAAFQQAVSGIAQVHSDNVFTVLRNKINDETVADGSPVTMLFGLRVTDQGAFMSAIDTIFESDAANAFPGNMFFGGVVAMGNNPVTHWVSFQASDLATLLAGVDDFMSSDDFAAYAANASSFREVTNRSIAREVLSFEMPEPG